MLLSRFSGVVESDDRSAVPGRNEAGSKTRDVIFEPADPRWIRVDNEQHVFGCLVHVTRSSFRVASAQITLTLGVTP